MFSCRAPSFSRSQAAQQSFAFKIGKTGRVFARIAAYLEVKQFGVNCRKTTVSYGVQWSGRVAIPQHGDMTSKWILGTWGVTGTDLMPFRKRRSRKSSPTDLLALSNPSSTRRLHLGGRAGYGNSVQWPTQRLEPHRRNCRYADAAAKIE